MPDAETARAIQKLDPAPSPTAVDTVADDPLWYKDAIIYQLHVKAFYDSSGDGVGDFEGLAQRLDYLVSLGVSAVWLLPFYPSPLRDDGYDIANYKEVHPSYGTLREFHRFVRAAHERGLKVITELVVNHTSDQHPWFQRARLARRGSVARNYYVWSDDDKQFAGTRIIFVDTETSNWTWDPVAGQYYWHRFFSHQPDLNFDNPRVVEEVLRVMKFWLDMGVDGLRLDAIPYLVEREGTTNENLPETHVIIKKLRSWLDKHYPRRMLLGEANQWPEDVLPYFGEGNGDECNMAFHFPLMPRMYMALAREDRHPITDIMRQTPDIPAKAQWAVFLRNHDELTLEMVTDRERDYLWHYYAAEPRARINLGIRRRLAPLVENDRRKIELLNSLLMSMPGTPIIYYGDEIGMGDNIYLGDRDGVRTPMQWSPDRNGGFSHADPQRLYLPPVMDPIYGFEAVNVEAQSTNASSLLNWMRRLIVVRQQHQAFGRGTLKFLYPGNRKVLAYLRQYQDETILCVANLSRGAQPVELNLSEFAGTVPVELMGRTAFPPIGELPYFITLPAYGFFWFLLASDQQAPAWHEAWVQPLPEFLTVVENQGWRTVTAGAGRQTLEIQAIPEYLPHQRWYAAKGTAITSLALRASVVMSAGKDDWLLAIYHVETRSGLSQSYFLPLARAWETREEDPLQTLWPQTIARIRKGAKVGLLYEAVANPEFARAVTAAILAGGETTGDNGAVRFIPTAAGRLVQLPEDAVPSRFGKEQSNTSLQIGDGLVLKFYRRLEEGVHPEVEVGRFLTEVGYANIPLVYGHAEISGPDGATSAVAILQAFVRNQGDGWEYTINYLDRFLEEVELRPEDAGPEAPESRHVYFAGLMATLGRRVAEMHRAFTVPTADPAFSAEPIGADDLRAWAKQIDDQAEAARRALEGVRRANSDSPINAQIDRLLANWKDVRPFIEGLLTGPIDAVKARYHGDLHLGQVVIVKDDFYLLDFEGEPARPLAERRRKHSPLRDVAGMLRSFDYAAWTALSHRASLRPDTVDPLVPRVRAWKSAVSGAFMGGYSEAIVGTPVTPADAEAFRRLLDALILEKAFYEICYEAANRPDWIHIPLLGVMDIMPWTVPPAPSATP